MVTSEIIINFPHDAEHYILSVCIVPLGTMLLVSSFVTLVSDAIPSFCLNSLLWCLLGLCWICSYWWKCFILFQLHYKTLILFCSQITNIHHIVLFSLFFALVCMMYVELGSVKFRDCFFILFQFQVENVLKLGIRQQSFICCYLHLCQLYFM